MTIRRTVFAAPIILLVVLFGCASGPGPGPQGNVDETREALVKYQDLRVALEEGYLNTYEYAASPEGGMGIHFFNPTVTDLDPLNPPILLYDLDDEGHYSLTAAEWMAPANVAPTAPVLFGQTFNGPMPGHGPDQPEHYDLHVWLFKPNPAGMFADFNPAIKPPVFAQQLGEAMGVFGRFMDFQVALDEGYINTEECAESPEGGMGIHFFNPTIAGVDPRRPPVLLYQPTPDGGFELLAVEWFAPAAAVPSAPVIAGKRLNGPMPGHEPDMPEHYDLHLWLPKTNPAGLFADFNPLVRC